MPDSRGYTFWIKDYRPETMQFGRLVAYYQQLLALLGGGEGIHLSDIVESSHGSQFAIDADFAEPLIKRLQAVERGTAPKDALNAQVKINAMLAEDRTSARLEEAGGSNVIIFPGGPLRLEAEVVEVNDTGSVVGELYHLAATQDDVHVRVRPSHGHVVYCTTSRDVAKRLRDCLFEEVRVSGPGRWRRDRDGTWTATELRIVDFDPVERLNLRQAVTRLRNLDIQWPEDPLGQLAQLNEQDG